MNREEAQRLVEEELKSIKSQHEPVELVVLGKDTIERPWGWVFFYQSKAYIESGDFSEMLVGNAPIIVNRHTSELVHTGTSYDIEHYLHEYEAGLRGSDLSRLNEVG